MPAPSDLLIDLDQAIPRNAQMKARAQQTVIQDHVPANAISQRPECLPVSGFANSLRIFQIRAEIVGRQAPNQPSQGTQRRMDALS